MKYQFGGVELETVIILRTNLCPNSCSHTMDEEQALASSLCTAKSRNQGFVGFCPLASFLLHSWLFMLHGISRTVTCSIGWVNFLNFRSPRRYARLLQNIKTQIKKIVLNFLSCLRCQKFFFILNLLRKTGKKLNQCFVNICVTLFWGL